MTELFDLESGNWRQSEVMRIFAEMECCDEEQEASADEESETPQPLQTAEITTDVKGNLVVELEPAQDEAARLSLVASELASWRARTAIVQLGNQAAKEGNIKAAYLIERAVAEMDDSLSINENEAATQGGPQ